jgi:hypothetical protein
MGAAEGLRFPVDSEILFGDSDSCPWKYTLSQCNLLDFSILISIHRSHTPESGWKFFFVEYFVFAIREILGGWESINFMASNSDPMFFF